MFDDLYSKAPYPINYFLEDLSSYILINFDNDFNIIGFNEKFFKKINLNKTKVKKYKFNEIFEEKNEKLNYLKLKDIEVYKRFECYLAGGLTRKQIYTDFTCYLFNLGEDGFYLLAKENNLGQGEIINKISKLNNELENTTRELNKKNLKLEFQNYFQKTLAEISSDLLEINSANIDRKLNNSLKKIGEFFNVDRSYIFQFNKEEKEFSNTHEWCREGIAAKKQKLQNIKADRFSWAINKLQNNKIINIKDVKNMSKIKETEQNLLEDLNLKSIVIMPMFVENELFGFFGFDSVKNKKEFSQEKIGLFKMFTNLITRAFSKYIYDKKIRKLTYKDRLTGLYNRRFFEEELERLNTKRQLPISIIIADINGLKIINDSLGHEKGDQLLKKSAEILEKVTRKEDILARQGGDEFAILLPKTEKEKAEKIIARINKKSRQTNNEELTVTMALGAAVKTDPDQSIEEILKKADNTMYQNKLSESRIAKSRIIHSLLNNLEIKSNETREHAEKMKNLAVDFGEELGFSNSELNRLSLLAKLHDIGKTTIDEKILKKTGSLTDSEWEIMKEHPERGYKIANSSEEFAVVAEDIFAHHESWDGSGYPRKLKGEEIPYLARIISIIDSYDVMTNDRPYSSAISKEEALAEIKSCAGSQFDPELGKEFIKMIKK